MQNKSIGHTSINRHMNLLMLVRILSIQFISDACIFHKKENIPRKRKKKKKRLS